MGDGSHVAASSIGDRQRSSTSPKRWLRMAAAGRRSDLIKNLDMIRMGTRPLPARWAFAVSLSATRSASTSAAARMGPRQKVLRRAASLGRRRGNGN